MQRFFTLIVLFAITISVSAFGQYNSDHQPTPHRDNARLGEVPGTLEFNLSGGKPSSYIWSSDGTTLAVPFFYSVFVDIYSVSDGRKLHTLEHKLEVNELQFSPDGTKIVISSADSMLTIWDVKTGQSLLQWKSAYRIFAIYWNKTGNKIVTQSSSGTEVFDATNGQKLANLKGNDYKTNYDNSLFSLASTDSTITIWDAETLEKISSIKCTMRSPQVAWSPKINQLFASRLDTTYIWSSADGSLLFSIPIQNNSTGYWSPDGKYIYFKNKVDSSYIFCSSLSGKTQFSIKVLPGYESAFTWSPDGTKYSTATDAEITFRSFESGTKVSSIPTPSGSAYNLSIRWNTQGTKVLLNKSYTSPEIWEVSTGTKLLVLQRDGVKQFDQSSAWSPNGSIIIASSSNAPYLWLWSATTGQLLPLSTGHSEKVVVAQWSPDKTKIASMSDCGTATKNTIVWDAISGLELFSIDNSCRSFNWSPDGSKLAATTSDSAVLIYSASNGAIVQSLKAKAVQVAWSPDGKRIATVTEGRPIIVWSADNGQGQYAFGPVTHVEWSPDGSKLATLSGSDGWVTISDAVTGAELFYKKAHSSAIYDIRWSPDSKQFATVGVNGLTIVWTISNGLQFDTLQNVATQVAGIRWSPDGTKIVVANIDKSVSIWNVAAKTLLHNLKGHTSNVTALQWKPDGHQIASGSYDSTAICWDATSGTKLFTMKGHKAVINSIEWRPDGKRIATASNDMSVKIWYADVSTAVQESPMTLASNTFTIYPNPASNQFTIHLDQAIRTESTLSLMNMLGQTVAEITLPTGCTEQIISTESLPVGMYIVKYNSTVQPMIKW